MKKLITLFLLASIVLAILAGCQASRDPNTLSLEAPSKEVRKEMYNAILDLGYIVDLTEYPNYCRQNAWYYGTINGCFIAFGDPGDIFVVSTIRVADCEFTYGYPFNIFVYKDGEACYLQDAYERGWLTKEHIEQLEVRHPEAQKEQRQAWEKWFQSMKETQGS